MFKKMVSNRFCYQSKLYLLCFVSYSIDRIVLTTHNLGLTKTSCINNFSKLAAAFVAVRGCDVQTEEKKL